MDRLREILKSVMARLGPMKASQKLALASLGLVLVLTLLLVSQLAGTTSMVALLPGQPGEDQDRAAEYLDSIGEGYTRQGVGVMVPASKRDRLFAGLQLSGNMPSDTSMLFASLIEKQSWTMAKSQQDQFYTIALQNEIARVIRNFPGVRDATVIIDAPAPNGLGNQSRKPTASATVFMRSGAMMAQETVDAVAQLVAGARSGLEPERVRVIDGSSGNVRVVTGRDRAISTTYIEHASRVERQVGEKLAQLLSYIPGVVVQVTAEVDVSQRQTSTSKVLPEGEGTGVAKVRTQKNSTTAGGVPAPGSQPGVRSNETADVDAGTAQASASTGEQNDETTESEVRWGTVNETVIDPRGMPTAILASIVVPRSYVEMLVKRAKAAGAGGPADDAPATEQEIDAAFDKERSIIEAAVRPHVLARAGGAPGAENASAPGDVTVSVTLASGDAPAGAGGAGGVAGMGMTGSMMGFAGGGVIEKGVLGLLGVSALGMMAMMIKKASKRVELPTPEEVVGLPPALEANGDIVGEADEGETPMAGIEIGEQELKVQKMVEQLGKMAGENPDGTAKLLGRWITTEE